MEGWDQRSRIKGVCSCECVHVRAHDSVCAVALTTEQRGSVYTTSSREYPADVRDTEGHTHSQTQLLKLIHFPSPHPTDSQAQTSYTSHCKYVAICTNGLSEPISHPTHTDTPVHPASPHDCTITAA